VHVALTLRLKFKIWNHLHWYLQVYDIYHYFLAADCVMEEEEFEEISLFSFGLYSVIGE
jgi:hypothetical protein